MRPRVELIYDRECPNVAAARAALLRALKKAGRQPLTWFEWDRASPESPAYVRGYASPTILVGGRDILGAEPEDGAAACRLYLDGSGRLGGVPPEVRIAAALDGRAQGRAGWWRRSHSGAWGLLASLPALVASLLPVGICPACWPLYAGILGSLGLGFLLDAAYLLPVGLVLFGLVLVSLAFRAKHRRGLRPFWLGSLSVLTVLVSKFAYHFDPLVYVGLVGLLAVSVWNAWPLPKSGAPSCSSCVPHEGIALTGNAQRSR